MKTENPEITPMSLRVGDVLRAKDPVNNALAVVVATTRSDVRYISEGLTSLPVTKTWEYVASNFVKVEGDETRRIPKGYELAPYGEHTHVVARVVKANGAILFDKVRDKDDMTTSMVNPQPAEDAISVHFLHLKKIQPEIDMDQIKYVQNLINQGRVEVKYDTLMVEKENV